MIYIDLLERMSLMIMSIYVFSQSFLAGNLIKKDVKIKDKIITILYFSIISIMGTYIGVSINNPYAIANIRNIGALTAGYVGGSEIGIIVGIISAVDRFFLRGFTAVPCALSTVAAGVIGGLFNKYSKRRNAAAYGFLAAVLSECLETGLILAIAKPFNKALELEKVIAFPMMLMNSIGVTIFVIIIQNIKEKYRYKKIEQFAEKSKFQILKAQIHPHFLFNSLNTVASLCRTNPMKARDVIINLSDYFRKTIDSNNDFVELRDEIDTVNNYLFIEKARFGDRIISTIEIPEDIMDMKVPPFIIQPLVENSVKHGLFKKMNGGSVTVKALKAKDSVKFFINDDGIGMSKEKVSMLKNNCSGIGIKIVDERLRLFYGKSSKLDIESTEGKGTSISFCIPVSLGR